LSDHLFRLQLQYAKATFHAARYSREAELLKAQLDGIANALAGDACSAVGIEAAPVVSNSAIADAVAASRKVPNFSLIAREVGVTPQHVRRVFLGLTTSARIKKALEDALTSSNPHRQGDDVPTTAEAPQPGEQEPHARLEQIFGQQNAASGARSAVAKRLGVSASHVSQVARGLRVSARVSEELQREMAGRGFAELLKERVG
jgi:transcriptional regulator with XRE-family HTH domain